MVLIRSNAKVFCFEGVAHHGFLRQDKTVNTKHYLKAMQCLRKVTYLSSSSSSVGVEVMILFYLFLSLASFFPWTQSRLLLCSMSAIPSFHFLLGLPLLLFSPVSIRHLFVKLSEESLALERKANAFSMLTMRPQICRFNFGETQVWADIRNSVHEGTSKSTSPNSFLVWRRNPVQQVQEFTSWSK